MKKTDVFMIATKTGERAEQRGELLEAGKLAMHARERLFTLTHLPSGLALMKARDETTVRTVARELLENMPRGFWGANPWKFGSFYGTAFSRALDLAWNWREIKGGAVGEFLKIFRLLVDCSFTSDKVPENAAALLAGPEPRVFARPERYNEKDITYNVVLVRERLYYSYMHADAFPREREIRAGARKIICLTDLYDLCGVLVNIRREILNERKK